MHSPQPSSSPRCTQVAPRPRACGSVVGGSGRVMVGPPDRMATPAAVLQRPARLQWCAPMRPASQRPAPACALRAPLASPARPAYSPCRWCNGYIAIQPCPCPLLPSHNTPECIAIQIVPNQVSCNTILQYNPSLAASVTVQLPSLQYNWAVAQIIFCTKFFFSLFFFSFVPATGKIIKIYTSIFFLHFP